MWAVLREGSGAPTEQVALCHLDGSGSLTYRQLDEAVGRRADLLDGAGIGTGSRLGVAVGSPHEVVLAVLAGTACGADVAVFNPGWWPRELRPALELAEPDLTVAGGELAAIAADIGPVCTPEEAVEGPGGWARLRLDVGGSRRRDGGYGDGTSTGAGTMPSDVRRVREGGRRAPLLHRRRVGRAVRLPLRRRAAGRALARPGRVARRRRDAAGRRDRHRGRSALRAPGAGRRAASSWWAGAGHRPASPGDCAPGASTGSGPAPAS